MANNNAPSNAFGPGNQPSQNGNTRGRSSKTKMLQALKKKMNWSEDDLYEHIATEAFINNNKEMIEIVIKTAVPIPRTTLQPVHFQYDRKLSYSEKCEVILEAVANGQIPPDVGQDLIQSIKHISTIHEATELEKRLNELEDLIRNFGSL